METNISKGATPNAFLKDGLYFVVPLKCGFTAFCVAAKRHTVQRVHIDRGQSICAVVRSPISRLKSFFNDKLRDNVNPNRLQVCQRQIVKALQLSDAADLKKVTFDELLELLAGLPRERWDSHIQPFSVFLNRFKVTHLINIDLPAHSHWLFSFLSLNPSETVSYNGTAESSSLMISKETEGLIRELYAEDFQFLKHLEQHVGLPPLSTK